MSPDPPTGQSSQLVRHGTELPAWTSVLAVVAHPDDESFGLGAVLDAFVRSGASVSVLCLTRGEASTLGSGPELSAVRAEELSNAADHLGIGSAVLLDYGDGRLANVPACVLEAEVLRELDERPAEGLVVFDPSGITGHPDHTAATRSATIAALSRNLPVLAWTLPH
ncbi:MAG: PIG-L deacetylase family protein, partial [Propionibacteriaceae bacterium]|nr:PIG-L deacetylase family protein [Propionibacteriaceae bacterium]